MGGGHVFCTVAVMHIEIDDGDVIGIVCFLCVAGGDEDIIEEAKAHSVGMFGVVPRGAGGDEGFITFVCHYIVDGLAGCACGVKSCSDAASVEVGVIIDRDEVAVGGEFCQGIEIICIVGV